eukprot:TRINITY_DN18255_c0_g1_i2.p1 TRINITY_DN18255_c0_g1~~TRINITY_DN18255_c0_g1_i2.p1  ORF type:complete len:1185 (-),score=207.22 TRINITY_DN18255_c0_g1_i2:503-4057(-)
MSKHGWFHMLKRQIIGQTSDKPADSQDTAGQATASQGRQAKFENATTPSTATWFPSTATKTVELASSSHQVPGSLAASASAAADVCACFGVRNVTLELRAAEKEVQDQEAVHKEAERDCEVQQCKRDALDAAVSESVAALEKAEESLQAANASVVNRQRFLDKQHSALAKTITSRKATEKSLAEKQQEYNLIVDRIRTLEHRVGFFHFRMGDDVTAELDLAKHSAQRCRLYTNGLAGKLSEQASEIERIKLAIKEAKSHVDAAKPMVVQAETAQKTAKNSQRLALADQARKGPDLDRSIRRSQQRASMEQDVLLRLTKKLTDLQKEERSADAEFPMLCRLAALPEGYTAEARHGKGPVRFVQLANLVNMSWCVSSGDNGANDRNGEAKSVQTIDDFLESAPARVVDCLSRANVKGPFLLQLPREGLAPQRYMRLGPLQLLKLRSPTTKTPPPKLNFFDLLRASLGDPQFSDMRLVPAPPSFHERALGLDRACDIQPPKSLAGHLRPYQLAGFRWMASLVRNGLGALLADDMGLGKTLQAIALLTYLHEEGFLVNDKNESCPALVVVPPGLLGNWQREFQQWSRDLKVHIYHGSGRRLPTDTVNVLLTTYQVARQDRATLSDPCRAAFSCMIIDEAQHIKNHTAQVTQAIKDIGNSIGHTRVALTGTPVENKVEELHSIFDFINFGYLGDRAAFLRDFSKAIEQNRDSAQRSEKLDLLVNLTKPFQLRRLKTDKGILPDLPDKIELSSDVELTKEQRELYQGIQEEWQSTMRESQEQAGQNHAFQRRGHVFAMLEKVRRICSHPLCLPREKWPGNCRGLVVSDNASASGKTTRLLEILDEVIPSGDKAVIFVMRKSVLEVLTGLIAKRFKSIVPLAFSGDLSLQERETLAQRFAREPQCAVMVMTLQSGGVGLNLTSASHVIHFDRCYNPAKEAQATDRCHRLGQRQVVCVHRLITQGTFEERLEEIMQRKSELSAVTITAAEDWIANYSDEALFDLFMLRSDSNKSSARQTAKQRTVLQTSSSQAAPSQTAPSRIAPALAAHDPRHADVPSRAGKRSLAVAEVVNNPNPRKRWRRLVVIDDDNAENTRVRGCEVAASSSSQPCSSLQPSGCRAAFPSTSPHAGSAVTSSSAHSKLEEDECSICMDAPCNVRLVPCQHRSLCQTCAGMVESCPLCRRPIQQRIKC